MIKRILIGALLALPLSIASIQTPASAQNVIIRTNNRSVVRRPMVRRPVVNKPVVKRKVIRQRLVPGYWEQTRYGRRWVPARYVRY